MMWYKRFVGDFKAKTSHLSLTERGAYNALLDHYYATEKPLPIDSASLCRIAAATEAEEVGAVKRVAAEFFPVNGDGTRHNKRADEEILKAKEKSKSSAKGGSERAKGMSEEERQAAAKKAADARWNA